MGVELPPLDFTECLIDSPYFRENLHKHERELEKTNHQIKRIIKEVKDLLTAAKQLSNAQRSFAHCLKEFTFECIGDTQTDDEQVIFKSLSVFSDFINTVEEERKRMLENASSLVVKPLEDFRKKYIGAVKAEKKKFEKQTAKFCQNQERYLNMTTKKPNSLQEADASVDMAERHFYAASMDYVYLIQETHERKKFEFVETLLTFMLAWLTFYHQGYEVAKDCRPFMDDLQQKIQKTRNNFNDFSQQLKKRMSDVQKQEEPVKNPKGCKEGYLYLLEKKAFGTTWTKHFCKYDKKTKEFSMLSFNQLTSKSLTPPETMVLTSCVRRMSDSIEKRFCFDLQLDSKPGVIFTFQALSEQDRKAWMDIMDGKEPTYTAPNTNATKPTNQEERILDEHGVQFVKRCIEVLESRGLEEQGIYRIVGVNSKVTKLLTLAFDKKKSEKLDLTDSIEWETKTITSALKTYLRNLPEPLMTYRYHSGFIAAVKNKTREQRVKDIHTLVYRIPKLNFEVLKMLIKHLKNVTAKSDKNLMNSSNLSVCFGPSLLRPEEETVAAIMDLKFYNIVVEILIDNHDLIFLSSPQADKRSPRMNSSGNGGSLYASNGVHSMPSSNLPATYISPEGSEVLLNSGVSGSSTANPRLYTPTTHTNHVSTGSRTSNFPPSYTCTVKAYCERPVSSSMFNVHENGGPIYGVSRYEPTPSTQTITQPLLMQRFQPTVSSQSESNILRIQSPTNLRYYDHLESNSTSSSNESLSSTSRECGTRSATPKKNERSSHLYMSGPPSYKSQGNVSPRLQLNHDSAAFSASSGHILVGVRVRRVRTLYACLGENDGELSFEPNQIITNVKNSQEPGWLEGTLNGKTGLIPENYVEVLP